MADKRCDNGHFIDESWDLCPYCPQEVSDDPFPREREAEPASRVAVAAPSRDLTRPVTGANPVVSAPLPQTMDRTVAAGFGPVSPKRFVVGWLIGLSGERRGESYPVRMGRNVIGRDRRSDILIDDDLASTHHADLVFRPEERRFILMDHNSTNGTYVNEAEIEPRRDLVEQDVIRIGTQRFLFMPLCRDGFHWDDEGLLK
ncbi:MAG TPA: FHA domain-containing protein [Thermoanaerobaculia bacterium]